MSQVQSETQPLRTLRLQNGQVYQFETNESVDADEIPIIDVSGMYSDLLEDRRAVAEKVREAAHRIGFFYIIGHGLDPSHAEEAFRQAKRFFATDEGKKMQVWTGLVPNEFVGYHPMKAYNRNSLKRNDLSEAFNWSYEPSVDPEAVDKDEESISIWPSDLPGFKEGLLAYYAQLLRLARRVTRLFALALHLPEESFDQYITRPEAGMRILHYPEQDASADDQAGLGAHTDFECWTIVSQDDSGGLEVLNKAGKWIKASPVPGSFVVNIGDCFMRQTNDYFVSTVHRVINKSGKERYSAPFFFGFDRSKLLEPVPTCVSENNPMKYPIVTAGEYYKWRANKAKTGNSDLKLQEEQ
ncbi:2-oxoglutarate-Fe(II) type oxidoreductase [Lasiodiplodia theobromae]|uniref:2-oxoglutarate-Fe(II) type oxidoreductase n=1 Tax=Lasiodiplodia theobromae TaxID=45133 RepID=A0A5N5DGA0_9PEZI|nr:2-oxoglutarate-Fe(II) type oxidoreductase [Lasiodiplodia theobromae]